MAARVDALQAQEMIAGGAQLFDVLPASIHAEEHLPGAVNLPLETFDPSVAESLIDRTRPIVVYCFDQH